MDTRDQALTNWLDYMANLNQPHHRPASLRRNYSLPVVMKRVGDDDGDESPSPEPRTDSRSGLPREIRAWRWLHIVKRDESFSLIFFSPNVNIWTWSWGRWSFVGPTRSDGTPQGGGHTLHPCGQGVGPLWLILSPIFFIYSKKISVKFQVIPRTFISAQK